jgi:hypothetical protein
MHLFFMYVCHITLFLLCFVVVKSHQLWNGNFRDSSKLDCSLTHWMHIPKTSSMFCLAIQHACCPLEYDALTKGVTLRKLDHWFDVKGAKVGSPFVYNISDDKIACYEFHRVNHESLHCNFAGPTKHAPISMDENLDVSMGLGIIREPKSRIISAFLNGVHCQGFKYRKDCLKMQESFTKLAKDKDVSRLHNLLKMAQKYVDYPNIGGQGVKMLLGDFQIRLDMHNETAIHSVVAQAIKRLRQFFFVGVFDEYVRSLKLFHALADKG